MEQSPKFGQAFFAPQLCVIDGAAAIAFYIKAFGALELRRWSNDDGSVHVAELSIEGALFHLRQETPHTSLYSPGTVKGSTCIIGLFVTDPDALVKKAIAANAREVSPVQDFDYGYRQGMVADPFGHHWLFEKAIH